MLQIGALPETYNRAIEADVNAVPEAGSEDLETELRALGWWSATPVDLTHDEAGRYLAPDRFLQFIVAPRMKAGTFDGRLPGIAEELSALPKAARLLTLLGLDVVPSTPVLLFIAAAAAADLEPMFAAGRDAAEVERQLATEMHRQWEIVCCDEPLRRGSDFRLFVRPYAEGAAVTAPFQVKPAA